MNNKLQAKDLINVGLFTVLYFVLGCCVAIPIGMVTLMAILSGLLMGLTGMGYYGVPCGIVFGFLGDMIIKSGNYKSRKKGMIGYAVFSLWMIGTYIPMYFMVEQSRASFASQFSEEYADKVMSVMPMWSFVLVALSIIICAFIGAKLGQSLLKKHFTKAGIA